LAALWNSEVSGVQDPVVLDNAIAVSVKLFHDFPQKGLVLADRKAAYVLEYKIVGAKIHHQTHKVIHQRIARIVEGPLPDHAETLTRRAAKDNVYRRVADAGLASDVSGVDVRHAAANGCAPREIELVNGSVNRVVLDGGGHIETRLFKPQAHPARPGEQVYPNRSVSFPQE
jgi:hypothetical protein